MKKTVKTVVSVLAAVSILLTCLVLVVFAASPKITMTTGATSNGQTELIISVSKGSDLATFQAAVKYEKDKVKLMSVEYLSGEKNVSNTDTEGVALVNDIWLESLNDETDIIRLVFSVPEDTKTTFTVEDIKATDSNDNAINFKQPVTATVKVKASADDVSSTDPAAITTTQPATTGSGSDSGSDSGSGSGISGGTNGTSPNTGRMIASAAGVCGAAAAAAAVVVVLKKKNGKEE